MIDFKTPRDAVLIGKETVSREDGSNWWTAFTVGLAGTVLVVGLVGYALKALNGVAITLFIILTLCGVFLTLCLAELAAAFPEKAGGLPTYAFETFKPLGLALAQHAGGLGVWGYWFGWFPVAPINAYLAALYIVDLCGIPQGPSFGPVAPHFGTAVPVSVFLIASAIIFGVGIPCWFGLKMGALFANVVGISCMVSLTLIMFLPLWNPGCINFDNIQFTTLPEGVPFSWQLILGWAFIFTWSVFGFEAAACYIGECKEPARDAKIAMSLSGLFGLFIYVGLPVSVLAVLGQSGLENLHTAGDPNEVFNAVIDIIFASTPRVKSAGRWFIGITLILNLVMAVLNALGGASRGLMQASLDGVLPRVFERTNSHGSPATGIAFSVACSLLFLAVGDPVQLYIISNMGYLLAVAVALFGYGIFRCSSDDMTRPFRLPWLAGPIALIMGMLWLLLWIIGGYVSSTYAVGKGYHWLFFVGLFVLALYFPLFAVRSWQNAKLDEESTSISSDRSDVSDSRWSSE